MIDEREKATPADEPMIELTPEEEADLMDARAEMSRGEFATEEEVQAVLAKYRA